MPVILPLSYIKNYLFHCSVTKSKNKKFTTKKMIHIIMSDQVRHDKIIIKLSVYYHCLDIFVAYLYNPIDSTYMSPYTELTSKLTENVRGTPKPKIMFYRDVSITYILIREVLSCYESYESSYATDVHDTPLPYCRYESVCTNTLNV
jgi:hypothetical protein